jgi:hypothetical protein
MLCWPSAFDGRLEPVAGVSPRYSISDVLTLEQRGEILVLVLVIVIIWSSSGLRIVGSSILIVVMLLVVPTLWTVR